MTHGHINNLKLFEGHGGHEPWMIYNQSRFRTKNTRIAGAPMKMGRHGPWMIYDQPRLRAKTPEHKTAGVSTILGKYESSVIYDQQMITTNDTNATKWHEYM